MKARLARCAAGFAALTLFAAACGGGESDETVDDVVTGATAAVTEAPTTTVAPTTAPPTTAAELSVDALELLRTAFENSATRSARGDMQMDMGELVSISAQFESDGNQNFAMTMNFGAMMGAGDLGLGLEIRFVDGAQYMQFLVPDELRELVGDELPDGWFTLDEASAAELGIICPSVLPGETPGDGPCKLPNDFTDQTEFITSAEIIGKEFIDGVSTTHIRYVLDMAAMTESVLGDFAGPQGLADLPFDMFGDGVASEVWIDQRNGLLRRASVDLGSLMQDAFASLDESETEGLPEEFASLFDISNVMDFYDYDADITIEAPPADEIVGDFGDIMGAGQGAG